MDIAGDMVDLRLMLCGVQHVSDSRENSFAKTRANVRETFHVTGHGIPNIGKQPFDAYISRHGFALQMHHLDRLGHWSKIGKAFSANQKLRKQKIEIRPILDGFISAF
jgi:hypothetical protein